MYMYMYISCVIVPPMPYMYMYLSVWIRINNCLSLTKVFRQFLDAVLRCVKVREGSEPGEARRKSLHLVLSDVQYHKVGQTHHAL